MRKSFSFSSSSFPSFFSAFFSAFSVRKTLRSGAMSLLLAWVFIGLACIPASNPFDPNAPLDMQSGYSVTGRLLTTLNLELTVPPLGIIRFQVDNELRETALTGQGDDDVAAGELGTFRLDVSAGPHDLRIIDVTGLSRIDEGFAVFEVNGAPGEEINVQTRTLGGNGYVYMRDIDPPGPFQVQPFASATTELALTVDLQENVDATDAQGNLVGYQFRSDLLEWSETRPLSDRSWTTSALVANGVTGIEWRAVDVDGNKGPANRAAIRHDDLLPLTPTVTLEAGNGFADLRWAIDAIDPDVFYEVHYGSFPGELNVPPLQAVIPFTGNFADEGLSPISAVSGSLRLTGLPSGAPIFAQILARDVAGNVAFSEVVSGVPAQITPERMAIQSHQGGRALTSARSGDLVFALIGGEVDPKIVVYDVSRASGEVGIETVATLNATDNVTDLAVYGRSLVLTTGSDTIRVFDLSDLTNITNVDLSLATFLPACNTFKCDTMAVSIVAGRAYVAVRATEPHVGGILVLNVTNPAAIVAVDSDDVTDGVQPLRIDLDRYLDDGNVSFVNETFNDKIVGPLKVFGRFFAIGVEVTVPALDESELDIVSPRGVLLSWYEPALDTNDGNGGPCQIIVPTINSTRQEIFSGDGIINPETDELSAFVQRVPFEVYGDYLTLGYDGWLTIDKIGGLGNDPISLAQTCTDAMTSPTNVGDANGLDARGTGDLTVATHSLGLLTATSVQVAGAYTLVASSSRNSLLGAEDFIDVLSTEDRNTEPGEEVALTRVGRIASAAVGPMSFDGTTLTFVGPDAIEVWQVFEPVGPRQVAAVGENPTGDNVAFGNYILHQRAARGIGVWDFANPALPSRTNAATCVPGCFTLTDLAGEPFVEGGWLFSATTGSPADPDNAADAGVPTDAGDLADAGSPDPDASFQTTFQVVDVSQPEELRTLATLDNPCANGLARGFAVAEPFAYLTCEATSELFPIALEEAYRPADVTLALTPAPAFDLGNFAGAPRLGRALLAARTGPERALSLYSLDAAANLVLIALGSDGQPLPSPTVVADAATLEMNFGQALAITGGLLYVLGGKALDAVCDPVLDDLSCGVEEHSIRVIDISTGVVQAERWSAMRTVVTLDDGSVVVSNDDRKMTLRAYPNLIILGRSSAQNRYEFFTPDLAAPTALAAPNALPLAGTIIGGHFVAADMHVYALE